MKSWKIRWSIIIVLFCLALGWNYWAGNAYAQPAASPSIPEDRWHYHILLPDQIVGVCGAFVDQRGRSGIPMACRFKNYVTKECHIFIAPAMPGARFAVIYEEKRCRGEEK